MPLLPPEIVLEVFVHVKHQGFFSGDIARARQKMLYSFCLVSHQWNRTFTPLLYVDVTLDDHNAGMELPTLLLRRTLWHTQPARKDLIERMQVFSSKKSPSTLWMVVLSNLPNLRELMIHQFDHSQFHPKLAQHIRSLSKRCTILLNPASILRIEPQSIPGWVRFLRSSQPHLCTLNVEFVVPSAGVSDPSLVKLLV